MITGSNDAFRRAGPAGCNGCVVLLLVLLTTLPGCSLIYKTTGDVMQGFSKAHTVPYLLKTDDLAMSCAMSQATAPLLLSFGRVTSEPDQLAVMLYLTAGGCAEEAAREDELQGLAALQGLQAEEAQDASIRQKRHYALAAQRYFNGWKHFKAYYGDPGMVDCPEFDKDIDGFIYMAGLLNGLQALNAEIQSTESIGVPKNIGSVVAKATGCLDNRTWWGAPMALRATVWAMLPGTMPQGEQAFERLQQSDRQGEEAGVRLAHVFHAIAAVNKGDDAALRAVIRRHAKAIEEKPAPEQWRLVDAMATQIIQAISDRMWVEHVGYRTPSGQLGTFWDDQPEATETMSLDGIL
ncbi:MAG: hypothetical protein R3303_04185 [Marinobacter sp.]|nr:hypothetical protein [Marinobacter sp.]